VHESLEANSAAPAATGGRPPLVIGCGALAPELVALTRRAGLPQMDLTCLPASLHNRPEKIPAAVVARIRQARRDGYDRIFVAYADCGTGGLLDRAAGRGLVNEVQDRVDALVNRLTGSTEIQDAILTMRDVVQSYGLTKTFDAQTANQKVSQAAAFMSD